jgi:hypothetical protein
VRARVRIAKREHDIDLGSGLKLDPRLERSAWIEAGADPARQRRGMD